MNTKTYAFKVMLFVDMFVCALIWRDTGITISSMTGLALRRTSPPAWAQILGGALNRIQSRHCDLAILHDIDRANAAWTILHGNPA